MQLLVVQLIKIANWQVQEKSMQQTIKLFCCSNQLIQLFESPIKVQMSCSNFVALQLVA